MVHYLECEMLTSTRKWNGARRRQQSEARDRRKQPSWLATQETTDYAASTRLNSSLRSRQKLFTYIRGIRTTPNMTNVNLTNAVRNQVKTMAG